MQRYPRPIKPNESTRTPANLMFVDSETIPVPMPDNPRVKVHFLRLWAANCMRYENCKVTRYAEHSGFTSDSFWDAVVKRTDERRPLWIFAHNLGFDLTALQFWKEIDGGRLTMTAPEGWRANGSTGKQQVGKMGFCVITDPPTIIECWVKCTRRRIVMVDTMNWYRCPLHVLGEEFGIRKLIMPQFEADDWKWMEYCKNDVKIIQKAMLTWIDIVRKEDMGVFKYTVSGQAFAAFKHRFMDHEITLHREERAVKLELDSYAGGEVRMGFYGRFGQNAGYISAGVDDCGRQYREGPIYQYDVTGFYPSVMQRFSYPTKLVGQMISPSVDDVFRLTKDYDVIARVKIVSDDNDYPVRRDGKSLNAVGKFITTLTTPDLMRAILREDIRGIGEVAYYERKPLFRRFVEEMYSKRCEYQAKGMKELAYLYKLFMNSLYGKFGQREAKWVNDDTAAADIPFGTFFTIGEDDEKGNCFRSINWQCQRETPEWERGLSSESFPAIAAHVTAYGRMVMRCWREELPIGSFVYQDTDSLHVTEAGREYIESVPNWHEGYLGQLRRVGVYRSAEYRGHKNYTVDDENVIAGIKKNARKKGDCLYEQAEFLGIEATIASIPPEGPIEKAVTIDVSGWNTCGRVQADGSVLPPLIED